MIRILKVPKVLSNGVIDDRFKVLLWDQFFSKIMSVIFKLAAFVGLSFLLRSLFKDWFPIISSFDQ